MTAVPLRKLCCDDLSVFFPSQLGHGEQAVVKGTSHIPGLLGKMMSLISSPLPEELHQVRS